MTAQASRRGDLRIAQAHEVPMHGGSPLFMVVPWARRIGVCLSLGAVPATKNAACPNPLPTLACQKENLRQWADRLGLLLNNWFASLGFVKITDAAYYRAEDNLGVFDAHDKNLVRADEDVLVPFDVIPCHPAG